MSQNKIRRFIGIYRFFKTVTNTIPYSNYIYYCSSKNWCSSLSNKRKLLNSGREKKNETDRGIHTSARTVNLHTHKYTTPKKSLAESFIEIVLVRQQDFFNLELRRCFDIKIHNEGQFTYTSVLYYRIYYHFKRLLKGDSQYVYFLMK